MHNIIINEWMKCYFNYHFWPLTCPKLYWPLPSSWLSSSSTRSKNSVSIRVSCSSEFCWVRALWTLWYLGNAQTNKNTWAGLFLKDLLPVNPHQHALVCIIQQNHSKESTNSTLSMCHSYPAPHGMKVSWLTSGMVKGVISNGDFFFQNKWALSCLTAAYWESLTTSLDVQTALQVFTPTLKIQKKNLYCFFIFVNHLLFLWNFCV